MKESYEEDLANHFGLQRRGGCGNVSVLSVRAKGNAGQPVSSEITTFACRPRPDLGKATSLFPLLARKHRTRRSLRTCACVLNPERENREVLLVSILMPTHSLQRHRWSGQKTSQAVTLP